MKTVQSVERRLQHSVVVVVAQEQAGGRVRTEFIQNFPFDYGAQFIHGEVGNPLYDYAARNGLLLNIPSFEGEGKQNLLVIAKC